MKTKQDYYSKVLGMSLTSSPVSSSKPSSSHIKAQQQIQTQVPSEVSESNQTQEIASQEISSHETSGSQPNSKINSLETNSHETKNNEMKNLKELPFIFLARSEDVEEQKDMIQKILAAVNGVSEQVNSDLTNYRSKCFFVFGESFEELLKTQPKNAAEKISENKAIQKVEKFPSFSVIAQNPNLKKELWEKLKGFKK